MRRRTLITLLAVRWGFAVMVTLGILAGFVAATTVSLPEDIPSFALRAAPVYRVEVGTAVFFSFYLATMALVLAMHNRAFTELGTNGVRAQDLAAVEDVASEDLTLELMDEVRALQTRVDGDDHVRWQTH
jgi:hypothetical protein